ncbi:MAG: tRNA (N(6)-L-threonylcarbamoyladenosine(37)-C(2))-methylthiotransferase MtaB [Lachnospiraceae bacterium]|nr:tRNA (N(6)-L-threonylcarbamoyladenosine(37)-C(2))-methylthiotransferase MtaB [Lachnospiraceae bacterium]
MKVAFCTLGCKVNFYETEKMMEAFSKQGFEVIKEPENADIYVINTCTVTNMADRKSRQMIRRGKKKNPACLVVAVGCYAQSDGEKLKKDSDIDLVLDNKEKEQIVEYIMSYLEKQEPEEEKPAVKEKEAFNHAVVYRKAGYDFVHERTRAFIKVQSGCNQFYTYCIIPFVRGKLTSRLAEDVVGEIRELAKRGFQEFVITGIHLSSYGVDLSEAKNFLELEGRPLLALLKKIAEIHGVERLRLGSLEPRIITEGFLRELIKNEKVCPHFHLSLQSGCDETLVRMNRHYTTAEYEEKCRLLRTFYDNPAITTDVIVGFPGETEEEFETTRNYLKRLKLAQMHIFRYSRRSGTKADKMEHQIAEQIKAKRSGRLLSLEESLQAEYNQSFLGKTEQVLFEETVEIEGIKYLTGFNERYVKIGVPLKEAEEKGYHENGIFSVEVCHVLKK